MLKKFSLLLSTLSISYLVSATTDFSHPLYNDELGLGPTQGPDPVRPAYNQNIVPGGNGVGLSGNSSIPVPNAEVPNTGAVQYPKDNDTNSGDGELGIIQPSLPANNPTQLTETDQDGADLNHDDYLGSYYDLFSNYPASTSDSSNNGNSTVAPAADPDPAPVPSSFVSSLVSIISTPFKVIASPFKFLYKYFWG